MPLCKGKDTNLPCQCPVGEHVARARHDSSSKATDVFQKRCKRKFSRRPSKKGTKGAQLVSADHRTASSMLAKIHPAPKPCIGLSRIDRKIRRSFKFFVIFHIRAESSTEKNMANKGCSQCNIKRVHHTTYSMSRIWVSGPWLIRQKRSDKKGKLLAMTIRATYRRGRCVPSNPNRQKTFGAKVSRTSLLNFSSSPAWSRYEYMIARE
mmetsp:Transcript_58912/g.119966  ORF Transcript_58912/g.119966 Transcript_58912/m.119966 type:complete len:208 (-) Transcript_58912:708-1331(-)